MACKFSCTLSFSEAFKENEAGVYHSDDGDVYTVKYKSNVCRDLLLKVEWTISKRVLFTVKLYNASFKRCFSSKGFVTNSKKICMKLRGAFNVSNSRDYKFFCLIECIPYIQFSECKEIPMELSIYGFKEPESPMLTVIENDEIFLEKTKYGNESTEINRNDNNFNLSICETSVPEEELTSEPKLENVNKEIPSCKSGFLLEKGALTCNIKPKEPDMVTSKDSAISEIESEMPVLMKNNSIKACDQNGELLRNEYESSDSDGFFKSKSISENMKNNSENNLSESNQNKLLKEPNMQILEYAENKSKDVSLNKKIDVIDDFGEEKITNVNQSFHNDLKSLDVLPEKNPSIGLPDLLTKNSANDQEYISSNEDSKHIDCCASKHTVSKTNYAAETQFPTLPENKHEEYLHEDKTALLSKDANATLELNDFYVEDNTTPKEDLASLKTFNICSNTLGLIPPKIHDNIGPQTVETESSPINEHSQIISEFNDNVEIDIILTDSNKSVSANLSSSKANSVFQTLVRKLSVDDVELKDIKKRTVRGSKVKTKNSESNSKKAKKFPFMESELKGLSMDMLDLLTSGNMADAVITSGEKYIKVHRAIVSARSSVLKETFVKHEEGDLKYRAAVDIPPHILEDVIVFLYVGLIEIENAKMLNDLYAAAEKYSINDLRDICAKHIPK